MNSCDHNNYLSLSRKKNITKGKLNFFFFSKFEKIVYFLIWAFSYPRIHIPFYEQSKEEENHNVFLLPLSFPPSCFMAIRIKLLNSFVVRALSYYSKLVNSVDFEAYI